ncbi:hypothetical protein Q7P37_002757 [Cladosporium fusiforme]
MANHHDMPIAVVGMGCRFPGDATSVDEFWDFMVQARTAISEVPQDRFNVDSFYHPSSARQGTMNVKKGYFLKEDISRFDAPFFSMTRDEAEATDPQQRLLLEVAYQAFENAGMPMSSLAGSPTSVYSACFMTDYKQISSFDSEDQPGYGSTGHSAALVANRVSWFFDLRGSSVTLDTGCSGSAVAFHLACESIRTGDAECALACGVNLILAPEPWMSMTAFNFLSPDGKSYTFDHRANGYARGEGFAAIVLKPLDKAIRDNDTIRAVVRATAVAQDGKTPGITLASRSAQATLLRSTYRKACLDMAQTGFFEAHGTGTVAGDAAELGAIGDAFSSSRRPDQPLIVGSVKTNVGHLEGTASLAGIIKAVLSLEKGVIPQNLNFERPNPNNDLEKYRITVPTSLTKWPLQGVRRASINCFGFGGTIAHVILDDAESYLTERMLSANHVTGSPFSNDDSSNTMADDSLHLPSATLQYRLLVLSSPEQDGVKRIARALVSYNSAKTISDEAMETSNLEDLCYTLNLRRSQFQWRSAIAVRTADEVSERLDALPKASKAIEDCKLCFIFTGQGAQWPGMGRELSAYPAFESSLRAADAFLRIMGADWSIMTELNAEPTSSRLGEPELSQTACTVLQCALVDLLKSWSVFPSACVGHSSGEIAAAYAAGAITRESAWKLAYYRGLASAKAQSGSMIAVGLSAADVLGHIDQINQQSHLDIACYNGPQNTTVSGDTNAIEALASHLDGASIFNRILKVDRAYHSAYMQKVASNYKDSLGGLHPGEEGAFKAEVFSSVTGKKIAHGDLDANYFVDNLISPVKFYQALTAASEAAHTDFVLEIGPHSALKGAVKQSLASESGTQTLYSSILQRGEHACKSAVGAAGSLWSNGISVDLATVNGSRNIKPQCLTDLPSYVFNHSRSYWWESHHMKAHRFRKHPRLDLLGAPDPTSTNLQMRWRNFLRVKEMPWVVDHQVQNTILYPGAGMLAMALEAGKQLSEAMDVSGFELIDVQIVAAIVIPNTREGLETHLTMRPHEDESDMYDFVISSRSSQAMWRENCKGRLHICRSSNQQVWPKKHRIDRSQTAEGQMRVASPRNLYELFENQGMKWGPAFQNVSQISLSDDGRSRSQIKIPDIRSLLPAQYEQPHLIHPATLDALFQCMVFALPEGDGQKIPTSLDYVYVDASIPSTAGMEMDASAVMHNLGLRAAKGSATMQLAHREVPLVIVEGLQCSAIDKPQGSVDQDVPDVLCSEAVWREDVGLVLDTHSNSPTIYTGEESLANNDFIETYVDLSGFKNPDLTVLEVGKSTHDLTRKLLETLIHPKGGIPRLKNYTLVGDVRPDLEKFRPFLEYRALDFDVELEVQGFVPASFDMVIGSGLLCQAQNLQRDIGLLNRLLRPGGKFLINEDSTSPNEKEKRDLDHSLTHLNFRTDLFLKNVSDTEACTKLVAVATKQMAVVSNLPRDIIVLCSASQRNAGSLASAIFARLYSFFNVPVIFQDVDIAASRGVSGSVVVSLLGLSTLSVQDWTESELIAFKHILTENHKLLWITQGAQLRSPNPSAASIMGVLRALRYEDSRLKPHALDLSPEILVEDNDRAAALVARLLSNILFDSSYDLEYEFAERDGRIMIPRMLPEGSLNDAVTANLHRTTPRPFLQSGPLQLTMPTPGQIDSLCFQSTRLARDLPEEEVQIEVTAHGVHTLDAMAMAGETASSKFGYSVAGTVISTSAQPSNINVGERIVVLRPGALTNILHAKPDELHVIPQTLTLPQAAGLAADFALAQYALVQAARLEPGESCLIEKPNSVLGQAALLFAKEKGANVSAFAADQSARDFLTSTCGLSANDIVDGTLLSSRNTVKEKRWDVILCDMDSDNVDRLWSCIADFGRLVQILPSSLIKRPKLGKLLMHSNAAFITVDLEAVRQHKPQAFHRAVREGLNMLSQEHSRLTELVREVPMASITDAFQEISQNRTRTNNLVLTARDGDLVTVIAEDPHPLAASLYPDATYLIVGGLGGLGRSIAKSLVVNGAKHLVFLSRSGGRSNEEVRTYLQSLMREGAVSAIALACDVADENQLRATLLEISQTSPPIKGVIQAAMVLHDALFENMTHADWQGALRPKIQGSCNLHNLLPSSLDFFVMLSSIAGEGGMRGQTNYAAGNAYQDALARHRRALQMPAVCIDVTVVLGVGVVAENPELIDGLKQAGVLSMQEKQLHRLIKAAITGRTTSDDSHRTPAQIITGVATGAYLSRNAIQDPIWHHDNRFTHMNKHGLAPSSSAAQESNNTLNLATLLPQAKSHRDASTLVTSALAAKLAQALGMAEEDVEASKSVSEYGVDSLVAVELRNWIQRRAKAVVSIFELMSGIPMRELASRIAGRSLLVKESLRVKEEDVEMQEE